MLLTHPYVIVISLDFSKAFDTVRYFTLLEKLAQLDILDNVYNWFADFFTGHAHLTACNGQMSMLKSITASIIQGSAIGPASYAVNAGDLKASTPGNEMCKFADDTYLSIPANNEGSRSVEIDNVEAWTLNRSKSKEIVFTDNKRKN
jgi:Reverse transcriptase (RNA-dependent DNA polymerase)